MKTLRNRGKELLTEEERKGYVCINPNMTKRELAAYYTFTEYDLEIINRHRMEHNRLGFAVQLCVLRYPGWPLSHIKTIPESVLIYIAAQINANPEAFSIYPQREATSREHMEELRQEYGYCHLSNEDYFTCLQHLSNCAHKNSNRIFIINSAIEFLRKQKIILPAISTIEKVSWEALNKAEQHIIRTLTTPLTELQRSKLDKLINPCEEDGQTPLSWLRESPGQSSPETFLKIIKKLDYIRGFELEIDIGDIHPIRFTQLARLGAKYEPFSFRRFKEDRRYAILVAHLLSLSQTLTDLAVEIHDRQIMILQSKGRKAQEELQRKNGKAVNEKVSLFADIGSLLIKAKSEGVDPFAAIEKYMPWEDIVASVEEAKKLARPIDYDYLDLLGSKFNHLRKYTPTLLNSLDFHSVKSSSPLLKALEVIRKLNASGKRKVPDEAPLDFVSKRWRKHVFEKDGTISRHYYEMAALTELRNQIRSGDIYVTGSHQYKDFDEYIISKEDWVKARSDSTHLAVDLNVNNYIEERKCSLLQRITALSKNIQSMEGVVFDGDHVRVERLEKDVPPAAKEFSQSLYDMLPRIKLTDLLMEVAEWTKFDEFFIHASTGSPSKEKEKPILMAALMAMGSNIGLSKMADATPDISYHQMANTAQWRMYDDAMLRAQAALVNFHHKLKLSFFWGDGSTSSSDGMRVQVGVSSLHADANPHYGTGKGATFYRFVSDQFSAFYSKVINTNAREAVHIMDGLLHHETDLSIEEHYTDTAGYTDQIFGLSHLLGFKFAPRIRDISDAKLYVIEKSDSFSNIQNLFQGKINLKSIQENYDDVLRLAHSIREGKVSGSLIMNRLGSYARKNSLATALREMGRIEKTIFILDYISDKSMRRKIQKGLNKGEAMHALARAVFFGKKGELRERAIQDQLQRASSLNILLNAIIVWNTVYLSEAVKICKEKSWFDESLLNYISPLGWEHINLLGEYRFNSKNSSKLRPLLNI